MKSDFPSLHLLRKEENNDLEVILKDFNQLLKKYTKKLIYKTYTYQDFNKKYDCILEEKSREIKLADSQLGNEILKDLYILSSKYEKIEKLVLSNNNIDDISLLSKMKFLNLKTLDLSLNQIKSIEPLSKMRLDHLTTLFFKGNNNLLPWQVFRSPFRSKRLAAMRDVFDCGRELVYAFGPTRSSQFVPARLAHCDSVQADYPIRPFFCTLLRNNPRKRAVLPSSVHESLLRNLLLCTHRQRTNPSAFRWNNYNKSA